MSEVTLICLSGQFGGNSNGFDNDQQISESGEAG